MPPLSTILYVEDEENDALLMQIAFQRAAIAASLHIVSDGRQAIDYLSRQLGPAGRASRPVPGLVLLDLNLPVLNGFQVLEWVRAQAALAELPVVIFSSSSDPKDQQRASDLGANGYMVKPVDMSRMRETVRFLERKWLRRGTEDRQASTVEAAN
jgi:DNA-binding response OmpR family regulator